MKYLTGVFLGVAIVLSALAWPYLEDTFTISFAEHSQENSSPALMQLHNPDVETLAISKHSTNSTTNVQSRTKSTHPVTSFPSSNFEPKLATQPEPEVTFYQWRDAKGDWVFSNIKPPHNNYQIRTLPKDGLNQVSMDMPVVRTKIKTKTKAKKKRYSKIKRQNSSSKKLSKQLLVAKNHTHCRWLVGRSYDLYYKIKKHRGSFRSNSCPEYKKRKVEMRKLARQGDACSFPYGYPKECR